MDYLYNGIDWIFSPVSGLFVQESTAWRDFFTPLTIRHTTLVIVLGGLMTFAFLLIAVGVKYNRWRKFNRFLDAMQSLNLEPSSKGTFAWMVKRNRLKEPLGVLRSRQIFDEMATGEIFRVLCSAGTVEAKEGFIDTVYDIRNTTFHPDRMERDETII